MFHEILHRTHDGSDKGMPPLLSRLRSIGSNRTDYVVSGVPPGTERVLDVGCAYGWVLDALSGRARELWGVDVDERALLKARATYPHIQFAHQTATALPFESDRFDVVILSEVLEHVGDENKRPVIDEAHRVLRRDGRLILTSPYAGLFAWMDPMDFKRRFPHIYRAYTTLTGYVPDTAVEVGHKHLSLREILSLLDQRFTIEDVRYCGLLMPFLTWALTIGARTRILPARAESSLNKLRAWESGIPYGSLFSFNIRMSARKK